MYRRSMTRESTHVLSSRDNFLFYLDSGRFRFTYLYAAVVTILNN